MIYYTSVRLVDGKPRKVIVDETGKIVNRNPSKDELKGLEKEVYKRHVNVKYSRDELLEYLRQYEKENGRPPTQTDFSNNFAYPNFKTYWREFGGWTESLILAGLHIDLMGPQGNQYRGRLAEIKIINHFKQHPIDLAGENRKSPCDGICPNGKTYDVKSSKLGNERDCYMFHTNNVYKEEIEIYYLLGFNKYYTKIEYGWRIPGEIAEKDKFIVGLNSDYEHNIINMEIYNITDKLKPLI